MAAFRPFGEMTAEDYEAVGLRSGLEVHQQLLTDRKLFCRCPAGRYSADYDAEILRHMRPTLSELGEYDGTALMEFKTRKDIIYRIHRDTVCTYEMDDTPPFMPDPNALDIALEVAMLLNLNLVDELHIARKQYLDGSIPTGFQRTTIVGIDGWIPYGDRRIRIRQLGMEEDSCREVSDIGHERVYLTDRLGMPLIEPVTEAEMRTPQEVAEVGEIIRRLLRSTGRVRTGMGATRQDVNVSVAGSTRIEIKGVPSLRRVPLLVHHEAMRQWNLLRIRDLLHERGITPETFEASAHDVTRAVGKTEYLPLRKALDEGKVAHCVRLRGFAGIFRETTQTDTTFAKEISDRVRVIACLTEVPNLAHSDSASESLSAQMWRLVRQNTGAGPDDALVVTWGDPRDVESACREVIIRAREATEGVPNETRQALRDGTTGFERILPGAERMYPDTDLPPMAVDRERVESIRAGLPEPPWDREARYREMGLDEDVVLVLSTSRRSPVFDRITGELGIDPWRAAQYVVRHAASMRRRGIDTSVLDDDDVFAIYRAHRDGVLAREGIPVVMENLAAARATDRDGTEHTLGDTLARLDMAPVDDAGIHKEIDRALAAWSPETMHNPESSHRHLMGVLMERLRGRAEGRRVSELLSAALEREVA